MSLELDFNLGLDQDTGDITIIPKSPAEKKEIDFTSEDLTQQTPTDKKVEEVKVPEVDQRFEAVNNQIAQLVESNKFLTQTLQGLLTPVKQEVKTEVDDDTLGELFNDVEKGKRFLSSFKDSIVSSLESKMQPVIAASNSAQLNQQVVNEFQQTAVKYGQDFNNYVPVMQHLINNIPGAGNLNSEQLYLTAKRLYPQYKPPIQTDNKQIAQQPNNVRQMPDRIKQTSTDLGTKEIKTFKDAANAALEELGFTGTD